ncbi:MAG TPA: glycerophosphodiester phosphodiesterase [Casimicrobiaceae bacterium]|nr:glycerophosphodiester phosphodiesterase [Casimicrobiaceae bacterium]
MSWNPARLAAPFILGALAAMPAYGFDIEGHRGARGLAPENTLAAFRLAIELGVDTIETDLGVTRDNLLVISHNQRLFAAITRDAQGRYLVGEAPRIHDLTFAQLQRYDVGRVDPHSDYARLFPRQKPSDGERIPTLQALIDMVKAAERPIRLNLETKLTPEAPDDAPAPEAFARLVVDQLQAAGVAARVTIQSFDWRTLVAVKRMAPNLRTSCLTIEASNTNNVATRNGRASPWTAGLSLAEVNGSVPQLVKNANCDVWSPFHRNVTPERIAEAHRLGLAVLPWTVNDEADMARLIDAGVDGLISDYPDRLREAVARAASAVNVKR